MMWWLLGAVYWFICFGIMYYLRAYCEIFEMDPKYREDMGLPPELHTKSDHLWHSVFGFFDLPILLSGLLGCFLFFVLIAFMDQRPSIPQMLKFLWGKK